MGSPRHNAAHQPLRNASHLPIKTCTSGTSYRRARLCETGEYAEPSVGLLKSRFGMDNLDIIGDEGRVTNCSYLDICYFFSTDDPLLFSVPSIIIDLNIAPSIGYFNVLNPLDPFNFETFDSLGQANCCTCYTLNSGGTIFADGGGPIEDSPPTSLIAAFDDPDSMDLTDCDIIIEDSSTLCSAANCPLLDSDGSEVFPQPPVLLREDKSSLLDGQSCNFEYGNNNFELAFIKLFMTKDCGFLDPETGLPVGIQRYCFYGFITITGVRKAVTGEAIAWIATISGGSPGSTLPVKARYRIDSSSPIGTYYFLDHGNPTLGFVYNCGTWPTTLTVS